MNKIPLKRVILGGVRYQLSMILDYGRRPVPFDVLFDTGSPFGLTLSQQDTFKAQIPYSGFPKGPIVPVGSLKYQSYILQNKKIVMKDLEETGVEFNVPELYLLICTKKDQKSMQEANTMPSLLGLKFLEENSLLLCINGKTKEGYLEKK